MGGAVGVPGQHHTPRRVQHPRGPLGCQRRLHLPRAGHARRPRRDPSDVPAPPGRSGSGSTGTSRSAQLGNRILTDRFRELADDAREFHLHDPLAVAAAIDPDVLTCRRAQVSVVTDGTRAWPHRRKLRRRPHQRGGGCRCRTGRRDRSASDLQLSWEVPSRFPYRSAPSSWGHKYNGRASPSTRGRPFRCGCERLLRAVRS